MKKLLLLSILAVRADETNTTSRIDELNDKIKHVAAYVASELTELKAQKTFSIDPTAPGTFVLPSDTIPLFATFLSLTKADPLGYQLSITVINPYSVQLDLSLDLKWGRITNLTDYVRGLPGKGIQTKTFPVRAVKPGESRDERIVLDPFTADDAKTIEVSATIGSVAPRKYKE